ncbi:MAG: 6-carboxytetrahydropterin synthase [Candidatus Marinimicrobia bacterium]|nr:6-carboxytetrahydropterin synthase [Candidatus Neomarinimicrobiota bacterium]
MANKNPILELYTRISFSAAHSYRDQNKSPEENRRQYGKNSHVHGHNYEVTLGLRGSVDMQSGMIINFFEVKQILKEKILSVLDVTHLEEDIPWFRENLPTTENITLFIYNKLKRAFPSSVTLISVEVRETPDLGAKIYNE